MPENQKKILILSYSFSGQTNGLLRRVASALEEAGITVIKERITTVTHLRFPVSSIPACISMMVKTFLRQRIKIAPLSTKAKRNYDLILLAGPTWSYNPSGPVLSLIDRDGPTLFKNKTVIPLISCRGYWRMHWLGLKHLLKRCGAQVPNHIVFSHPNKEPWSTVGVFLKIAGKNPERHPFLGKYYYHFGHTIDQQDEAAQFGKILANALNTGLPLESINFQTPKALP
nr:flavodoxin family protein [Desulfobulbaceae bacterium]